MARIASNGSSSSKKPTSTSNDVLEILKQQQVQSEIKRRENEILTQEKQKQKEQEERKIKEEEETSGVSFSQLQDLFGFGFTESECRQMYKQYLTLQNNYPIKTAMHQDALVRVVKYGFKESQAIANDDEEAAQKWGKLCKDARTDAKMNPSQLSAADLSDGISNFSKIVEAVEREVDIIPSLPRFKQQPQDAIDYTLWQFINYIRRLQNLPEVKYREIYSFLDKKYKENKDDLPFLEKDKDGKYDEEAGDL